VGALAPYAFQPMPTDAAFVAALKTLVPFTPQGAIPLPAPADGEVTVLSFSVPIGYDGLITAQCNGYINGGVGQFVEGSGDIVWRIPINNVSTRRYLKDSGAIYFSLGQSNIFQRITGGYRIYSGNTVSVVALAPNTSGALPGPGVGQVFAGLRGYFFPRR